jgi:hypothetical protein
VQHGFLVFVIPFLHVLVLEQANSSPEQTCEHDLLEDGHPRSLGLDEALQTLAASNGIGYARA